MNQPKAIEAALQATIKKHGAFDASLAGVDTVNFRPWQSLADDETQDNTPTIRLPLVDIRASSPTSDSSEWTYYSDVSVVIATSQHDDRLHRIVSAIYDAVAGALLDLVQDSLTKGRKTADGVPTPYGTFSDALEANTWGAALGGLSLVPGTPPYHERDLCLMAIGIRVHYTID